MCCVGIVSFLSEICNKTYADDVVYNDFEVNYDNSRCMKVSGRNSANDGASSSKGFYLSGAVEYDYSLKVYNETDETFHLNLLCIDETTDVETVINLADKKVKAGKWKEISANYKAPENTIKDFNSIECENEMKPDATLVQSKCSSTDIGVSLNNASAIMDFCVQNNIAMRGHTFVWHSQTSVWFFKENCDPNGNWILPVLICIFRL